MSTRGAVTGGLMKAQRGTKAFAMDGSNSLRFSLGEPALLSSQHHKLKRETGYLSGRINEEFNLAESVEEPNYFGLTKSAVVKKRRSANL